MRQITAAEVKPGMEVQFDLSGWDVKGTVATVDVRPHAVWIYTEERCEMSLDLDTPVTVLAEPHPEEPTAFGARVVADGMLFVRADDDANPWRPLRAAMWVNWRDVCALGEVTVIDADPSWTLPAQVKVAPVVPERIEEWPERDEHLRAYQWRDCYGVRWHSERRALDTPDSWVARLPGGRRLDFEKPTRGPWTRVADA